MLQEIFPQLVSKISMPKSYRVWEGSRFCVDSSLQPEMRKRIMQEIIVGYLEFGLDQGVSNFVGVMYPAYWRNIFISNGWDVEFLGEPYRSDEGHKIIAGSGTVSRAVPKKVRDKTGIRQTVLNYGEEMEYLRAA